MQLPERHKNQHCDGCGHGPTFKRQIKKDEYCGQNIRRALWDGAPNTCQWFEYVPGADLEVDQHGCIIDQ
jgi:hypothetical protein